MFITKNDQNYSESNSLDTIINPASSDNIEELISELNFLVNQEISTKSIKLVTNRLAAAIVSNCTSSSELRLHLVNMIKINRINKIILKLTTTVNTYVIDNTQSTCDNIIMSVDELINNYQIDNMDIVILAISNCLESIIDDICDMSKSHNTRIDVIKSLCTPLTKLAMSEMTIDVIITKLMINLAKTINLFEKNGYVTTSNVVCCIIETLLSNINSTNAQKILFKIMNTLNHIIEYSPKIYGSTLRIIESLSVALNHDILAKNNISVSDDVLTLISQKITNELIENLQIIVTNFIKHGGGTTSEAVCCIVDALVSNIDSTNVDKILLTIMDQLKQVIKKSRKIYGTSFSVIESLSGALHANLSVDGNLSTEISENIIDKLIFCLDKIIDTFIKHGGGTTSGAVCCIINTLASNINTSNIERILFVMTYRLKQVINSSPNIFGTTLEIIKAFAAVLENRSLIDNNFSIKLNDAIVGDLIMCLHTTIDKFIESHYSTAYTAIKCIVRSILNRNNESNFDRIYIAFVLYLDKIINNIAPHDDIIQIFTDAIKVVSS